MPNTVYRVPFRILLIQRQEKAADLSGATTSLCTRRMTRMQVWSFEGSPKQVHLFYSLPEPLE